MLPNLFAPPAGCENAAGLNVEVVVRRRSPPENLPFAPASGRRSMSIGWPMLLAPATPAMSSVRVIENGVPRAHERRTRDLPAAEQRSAPVGRLRQNGRS